MKFTVPIFNHLANKKNEINAIFRDIYIFENNFQNIANDWCDNNKENQLVQTSEDIINRIYNTGFLGLLFGLQFILLKIHNKYKSKNIRSIISKSNVLFLKDAPKIYHDFLVNSGLNKLNSHQLNSIFIDDCCMQVIARAGCGKTSTLIGKIKYLLDVKKISPQDIKVISFSNHSVNDIKRRFSEKDIKNIEPQTFHRFAMDVFENKNNITPYKNNENILLKHEIEQILNYDSKELCDVLYSEMLYNYSNDNTFDNNFSKHIIDDKLKDKYKQIKNISTQESKEILNKILNKIDYRLFTLKGELVKSKEEVFIANFLYLHKINYIYEDNYFKNRSSEETNFSRYFPDFHLTDYDIYLEHFGVNLKENVNYCEDNFHKTYNYTVPWLDDDKACKYINNIIDKRELHKKFNTKLIESYSFFNTYDNFFENLSNLLTSNGVVLSPLNNDEAKNALLSFFKNNSNKRRLDKITSTYYQFIELFKTSGFTKDKFDEIRKTENLSRRDSLFLNVVEKIYDNYERKLVDTNTIDFNDMIIKAKSFLENCSEDKFQYKYLIIDEFQDINRGRFNFVREFINKSNCKLFSVGDDWQSIYGFNGSNVSFFSKFNEYFPQSRQLFLPITYRFNQYIVDISKKFITKNKDQLNGTQLISYDQSNDSKTIEAYQHTQYSIEELICNKIFELNNYKELTFLILGRYKIDFNNFSILTNDFIKEKKLKLQKMTIHQAKGIEADVVFVLLKNGEWGFPNQVEEEKVLRFVKYQESTIKFAEERRVFYVALTRAKKKVFIINQCNNDKEYSDFMKELTTDFNIKSKQFSLIKANKQQIYKEIANAIARKTNIELLYKHKLLRLEPIEIKKGYQLTTKEVGNDFIFSPNNIYIFCKNKKLPYNLEDLDYVQPKYQFHLGY
ncbi:MAG: UvrD-helicase domain-containing protein [Alphaproteobacteria bacterium]|nr:UvrD-helicase domain-containing protein [Alphaproteobacteria bacterium]